MRGWLQSRRFVLALGLVFVLALGLLVLGQSARLLPLADAAKVDLQQQAFAAAGERVAAESPQLALQDQLVRARGLAEQALASPEEPRLRAELEARYQDVYRTPAGLPYVYDFDSYYFLERASRGDTGANLLVLLESALYRARRAANPALTPSDAVFFLPLVFGLLTLAAVFFLLVALTQNVETAVFGSVALALQHRFYAATGAGMGDSQSLFMLLTVLCFLLVVLCVKAALDGKARRAIAYGFLALSAWLVFAFSWRGALLVPVVLVCAGVAYAALRLARQRSWKWLAALLSAAILAGVVFSMTPPGKLVLWHLKLVDRGLLSGQIDELAGQSLALFGATLGGWALVALALAGLLLALRHSFVKPSFAWLVLGSWLVLLGIASYQTIRFAYYALPPVAVFAGIALQHVAGFARARLGASFVSRAAVTCGMLVFLAALLVPSLVAVQHAYLPKMNDAIVAVGDAVNAETPVGARIISWWDYGHHWRYAAKREPILDGRNKGVGELAWARLWATSRSFLAQDAGEARNAWTALLCMDRSRLAQEAGQQGPFRSTPVCAEPASGVVIVDEYMLEFAPSMAAYLREYGGASGSVAFEPVARCEPVGERLRCGERMVDVRALTASDGIPVLLTRDGLRRAGNATAERVLVVYESAGAYYSLVASSWFANTALVRLFSGDGLGLETVAVADEPHRIVAYRFRPPR